MLSFQLTSADVRVVYAVGNFLMANRCTKMRKNINRVLTTWRVGGIFYKHPRLPLNKDRIHLDGHYL